MTAADYRLALVRLGLTQASAAEFLGICIRTSHGYANGKPIPLAIGNLLAVMQMFSVRPHELPYTRRPEHGVGG